MSTTLKRIAELTEERQRLYALGRWLTTGEQQRVAEIGADLARLWELRRAEIAQGAERDHELVVVAELKERAV